MNNLILPSSSGATMSSREIAELVGSRHDKVKQSIERLANRKDADGNPAPVIDLPPMGEYLDTLGRPATHYVFTGEKGKRDSYVVVAQLSPEFTAKLVDRWEELEARQAPPIPQTYAAALLEAGRLAQLAERQAEQLELAAPKVGYYDKVVERDTLLNATQVGQKIGLSAVMLNRHLDDLGVYNKSIKRGRAFRQSFVDAGHGIMRQTETGHAQPMITLAGEAWIIEKLTSEGII